MTNDLLSDARKWMYESLLSRGALDDAITEQIAHGHFALAEFLLLRVAEDEAEARRWRERKARWPSTRVLAECEAKRRIVFAFLKAHSYTRNIDESYGAYAVAYNCVLKELAAVYGNHPDYDRAWTPT